MTKLKILPSHRLIKDGKTFYYKERYTNEIDFVSINDSATRIILTDEELAEQITQGNIRLISTDVATNRLQTNQPTAILDTLTESERSNARRKLSYVKEIYQISSNHLSRSLIEDAVKMIALQLRDPKPPSYTTIYRWLSLSDSPPKLSNFIPKDHLKGNRQPRFSPDILAIIDDFIETKYLTKEKISIAELHEQIGDQIDLINSSRVNKLTIPSYTAVRRAIHRIDPSYVMEKREGIRAAEEKYAPVRLQKSPMAPLELVELDHTKADLFVIDDITLLPLGRPEITAGIDRCTRMPTGIYIGFDPPSTHCVIQFLKNSILPKRYVNIMNQEKGWNIRNTWPVFGLPNELLVDRALHFISEDIGEICGEIGIDMRVCPRKSPKHKGAIERFLGHINRRLLQSQKGTTFSNVISRKDYNPSKNAIIKFSDLQHILHKWLTDIYPYRYHKGLKGYPIEVWNNLADKFPVTPLMNISILESLLGKTAERKISRTGIFFKNLQYISDEIVSWRHNPEFIRCSPDFKVKFRYDPANISAIKAINPINGQLLTVPASDQEYTQDLSLWQHMVISKHTIARTKDLINPHELRQSRRELSESIEILIATNKSSIKSRSRAARLAGIGKYSMAGNSTTTDSPRVEVTKNTLSIHSKSIPLTKSEEECYIKNIMSIYTKETSDYNNAFLSPEDTPEGQDILSNIYKFRNVDKPGEPSDDDR